MIVRKKVSKAMTEREIRDHVILQAKKIIKTSTLMIKYMENEDITDPEKAESISQMAIFLKSLATSLSGSCTINLSNIKRGEYNK